MKLHTGVVGGLGVLALIAGSALVASPATMGLAPSSSVQARTSAPAAGTAPTDILQLRCTMKTRTNAIDDYAYRVAVGVTAPDGHVRKRFFTDPPVGVTVDFTDARTLNFADALHGTYVVTLVVTSNDGTEPASLGCTVQLPGDRSTTLPQLATVTHWREQASTTFTYFPDGTL